MDEQVRGLTARNVLPEEIEGSRILPGPNPAMFNPGLHWSTALRCSACKTVIRYVDEAPTWRESEKLTALVREAREYLAANGGSVRYVMLRDSFTGRTESDRAWERLSRFWLLEDAYAPWTRVAVGMADIDTRCVDCPSCGAEVFVDDGVAPES